KTSSAMIEAKSKLWEPVDLSEDTNFCNIYICYIITEVFESCHSKLNQEFAIAVIDMMFDPTITTTSLTEEYKSDFDYCHELSLLDTPSSVYYNDNDYTDI
ncbi:17173_t:CDS:2, partial [Racocetra persica]